MARCVYCELDHPGRCPMVRSIEYYETGAVKRVEFHDVRPIVGSTTVVQLGPGDRGGHGGVAEFSDVPVVPITCFKGNT